LADPARIPVYIFAAYPAVRAGLFALLSDDPTLEPIAPEPVSLRRDRAALPDRQDLDSPAVVVVDRGGIDDAALDEIRDTYPAVPLVLIGGDPRLDGPGLAQGTLAYLAPDIDGPTLIAAVRAVLAGLTVIDPVIAGSWLRPPSGPDLEDARVALVGATDILTDRERQVLELVAAGLPNKAIARELGISEHTVKFHVGSLLGKLGAGSRTEAVTLATRRGLLTI
jgi:DNA-binding NarL/FixJ family response regulator